MKEFLKLSIVSLVGVLSVHLAAASTLKSISAQTYSRLPASAMLPSPALPTGQTTLATTSHGPFYVSPVGNDGNPGTKSSPFRTLDKARRVVRTVNRSMTHDIVVYLRGGEYRLSDSIEFDQDDSGMNGYAVIYKAYPGELPVISGGQAVTGWMPDGNGLYKASAGLLRFRQLYVNGVRAVRARTPNQGAHYRLKRWDPLKRRIEVDSTEVGTWQSVQNVEMIVQKHWNQNILRIASLSPVTVCSDLVSGPNQVNKSLLAHLTARLRGVSSCVKELLSPPAGSRVAVTSAEPERTRSFNQIDPPREDGQPYHFENAYEFLDAPGEWYLNPGTGEVFYRARPGEKFSDAIVMAPRLETLVRIQGGSEAPVHHIQFQGLTFEYTTWLLPSDEGFLGDQAGVSFTEPHMGEESIQYKGGRMPAGVYLENADNISFEGNTFRHMGASAILLHAGTHDIRLIRNAIEDISGNGLSVDMNLEGNPSDQRKIPKHVVIQHNHISRVAQDYYGSVGLHVGYADSTTIEHNEVNDMPYTGISVGWGWTLKETALRNNVIRNNHVHHVMNLLDDGGGIYTLSKQPGTYISENHIHDIRRSPWAGLYAVAGIYLDNGSDWITVENNVFQNVEVKIHQNTGSNSPVGAHNIFVNN